jgi:hypothetical protein
MIFPFIIVRFVIVEPPSKLYPVPIPVPETSPRADTEPFKIATEPHKFADETPIPTSIPTAESDPPETA